jgi:hypothetical protein
VGSIFHLYLCLQHQRHPEVPSCAFLPDLFCSLMRSSFWLLGCATVIWNWKFNFEIVWLKPRHVLFVCLFVLFCLFVCLLVCLFLFGCFQKRNADNLVQIWMLAYVQAISTTSLTSILEPEYWYFSFCGILILILIQYSSYWILILILQYLKIILDTEY